jgi:RimJ/RimL family protein N-acetyltransferase
VVDLGDVAWPAHLTTDRVLLRPTKATDRRGYIDLLCSEMVRQHLGGPLDRLEVESAVPEVPGAYAGVFAVEHQGVFVGTVMLDRRDPARPGHTAPEGLELEVSYVLLPDWWGLGIAYSAVAGVLGRAARSLSDSEVLVCTQESNLRSMTLADRLGFVEVHRFEEFGKRQWLGVRQL